MKQIFLLMLLFASAVAFPQVGVGTTTPNPNAELDITSSTKGVLIPRLDDEEVTTLTANMTAGTPVNGMLVFNTSQNCIQIFTGSAFECLTVKGGTDASEDAFMNDDTNTMVKLGTKSNGVTARSAGTDFVIKDDGKVGIGTNAPKSRLDVKGYVNLGGADASADALTAAERAGMLRYNTTNSNLQYHNSTEWVTMKPVNTVHDLKDGYNDSTHSNLGVGGTDTTKPFSNITTTGSGTGPSAVGSFNTAFGIASMHEITTGIDNAAFGFNALYNTTSGSKNLGIGTSALLANTTGKHNVAAGVNSLLSSQTASGNTALGYLAGRNVTAGYNTFVGFGTGNDITSGANNTFVGAATPSGGDFSTGNGITTGSNNTIIGSRITGLASSLSNNIIIADGAGNQRIRVLDNGNTGIGTTAPVEALDVNGKVRIATMSNLSSGAKASPVLWDDTSKTLVKSNSTVVMGNTNSITPEDTTIAAYKFYVQGTNDCGSGFVNEYLVSGNNDNSIWNIAAVAGSSYNNSSFSRNSRNSITATNNIGGCADGTSTSTMSYTVTINPSTGAISFDSGKTYNVRLEKLF